MATLFKSPPVKKGKFQARPRPNVDHDALMEEMFTQNANTFADLAK